MRLLLDTHIWVWSITGNKRLARSVARVIENPRNELWLSPISIWEVIVLTQKGRLKDIRDGLQWIDRARAALPLREATLTEDVAREAGNLKFEHKDPADQLIVATARSYNCTLATADALIVESKLVRTLANT